MFILDTDHIGIPATKNRFPLPEAGQPHRKAPANGSVSADEHGELEEYERLEHLGRMLKARLRQKKNS